jgi:predicted CopG family antitoxin
MQQGITREQLWEKLSQLDPFQQQSVADFIESLLQPRTSALKRDKKTLLALSAWTDEDIDALQEVQDRINAWSFPAS